MEDNERTKKYSRIVKVSTSDLHLESKFLSHIKIRREARSFRVSLRCCLLESETIALKPKEACICCITAPRWGLVDGLEN